MENPITKRNGEYWNRRFTAVEQLAHNENARTITEIERHFINAQRELDQQINAWYARFAGNNQITLSDSKRWLDARELSELKWDVNEYIKHAQAAGMHPGYIKQLENASARFHISRLEALKIQTDNTMMKLFSKYDDAAMQHMKRAYSESYYRTCYEIQRGVGVGWDMAAINETALDKVISRPWTTDGNTFSDRIWNGKKALVDRVHTELTQNMILGRGPDRAIKSIAADMGVSRRQAGRLVMTESAYFQETADYAALKSLGVEWYEIIATLDRKTSQICQDMDGEKFPMSQYQVGVTAPPFHPWCRTTKAPYFEDDDGERIARNADGKTYKIPGNMKYKDWKKTFINPANPPATLTTPPQNATMRNYSGDMAKKLSKGHYDAVHDKVEATGNEALQKIWGHYESQINVENTHGSGVCRGNNITFNLPHDSKGNDWSKPYATFFHESGHAIDTLTAKLGDNNGQWKFSSTYKDALFPKTIKKEVNGWVNSIYKDMKAHKNDLQYFVNNGWINQADFDYYTSNVASFDVTKRMAYNAIQTEMRSLSKHHYSDISDILQGATNHKIECGIGHGKGYWSKRRNNSVDYGLGTEAFAEMFSASITSPESLETLKKYLPESYRLFDEMVHFINDSIQGGVK